MATLLSQRALGRRQRRDDVTNLLTVRALRLALVHPGDAGPAVRSLVSAADGNRNALRLALERLQRRVDSAGGSVGERAADLLREALALADPTA